MTEIQTAAQPTTSWSQRMKGLLQHRDYRLLWVTGGLDNTGRWMDSVVMGLLVLDLTDSAFQVALLFMFRWSPMLVFALISGMVADRANRWAILILARSVAVVATGALLVLVAINRIEPWHVFIASFFLGCIFVLEFPSRRSLIYDLVGSERIVGAMSLETINSTVGKFAGPFMAGLLIELTGFTGPYIFLIAVYIVALILVFKIEGRGPIRSGTAYPFWQTVSRGLSYSLKNNVIRSVLMVTFIFNALSFSVESLYPVVARDHLGVGAGLTGILISAPAIGSLLSASVIASLAVVRYHGRIFCLGLTLQMVSVLLFALSPWYPISVVLLMVAGLGAAGFSAMQTTIIMISSEPEMRGTALGMLGHCIGVAALGGLGVGVVANILNAQTAVALSITLGLILLVPVMVFSPLVKKPTSPPELSTN